MAVGADDYMTRFHRSRAELVGKMTGLCQGKGGSRHLADFSACSAVESGITGAGPRINVEGDGRC